MRICFIADFYHPYVGGGEIYLQNLVEGLVRNGEECVVITSKTAKGLPPIEEKGNIKIVRIAIPPFAKRAWFVFFAIPAAIYHARRCDIINGVSFAGAIPAIIAGKIFRKRCVFILYDFLAGIWNNLGLNWFSSRSLQMMEKTIVNMPFDKVIAHSRYTRNCVRLSGVPDRKIEFVYGGMNPEILNINRDCHTIKKELGFGPKDFIYLAYGRAGITKGMDFFIEAIPLIIEKVPNAKFLFILSKTGQWYWRNIMNKMKKIPKDLYRFLPAMPREDLPDYLNIADCIVVPSISESFGFVVIEACALKKRLVATDAGSVPEVVFGDHILVKPASAKALAEGCRRAYIKDLDYCEPKKFDWEDTIVRYKNIYEEILG